VNDTAADPYLGIQTLAEIVRNNLVQLPKESDEGIDVGFLRFKAKDDSTLTAEAFADAIRAAEKGYHADEPVERLAGGPSYIELGGWIGDQGLAMAFMALGNHLGLWEVVTPQTLGIEGEQADQMMGMGFIMIAPRRGTALIPEV